MDSQVVFSKHWNVAGELVIRAVQDFFSNGKLLLQVNATKVVLIPKGNEPKVGGEFRSIASSNTVYKMYV